MLMTEEKSLGKNSLATRLLGKLVGLAVFTLPLGTSIVFRNVEQVLEPIPYSRIALSLFDILALLSVFFVFSIRREKLERVYREMPRSLFLAIAVFELMVFLSIFWARDWQAAFFGWTHLLLFLVFALAAAAEKNAAKIGLIAAGVFQSIIAIGQFLWQASLKIHFLGMASHDAFTLGTSVVATGASRWLRAYGTLPHPNILGGFLVVALILLFGFFAEKRLKRRQRIFALAVIPILSFGLFVTYSRSAFLAYAIAIFIYFIKKQKEVFTPIVISILLIIIIGGLTKPLVAVRLQTQERLEQKSFTERIAGASQAFEIIKAHPFRGIGYHNMAAELAQKNLEGPGYLFQPVHSIFLLALAELGPLGMLALIIILLIPIIKREFNPSAIALAAVLIIIGFFDHWLMSLEVGTALFWIAAALTQEGVDKI